MKPHTREDFENKQLKELIAAYEKDRNLFGPARTPSADIDKMCLTIKQSYLEKIVKLTPDAYATGYDQQGKRITNTFCSELERILKDIGKLRDDHFGVRYNKNHEFTINL